MVSRPEQTWYALTGLTNALPLDLGGKATELQAYIDSGPWRMLTDLGQEAANTLDAW